jgi:glycosyltransferase involved in cell wall biosynthesis
MKAPLISICLPNLNTRPFLEERMETLLAQTFRDWELIISDNFSDDGSWELFQKFKDDPRVRLSQAPRCGMYANWNECLRRAQGKYLYVATSDDTASPELLERLVAPLERSPDIQLAYCDFEAIDEQSKPLTTPVHTPQLTLYGEWMKVPCIRDGKTEFLHAACVGPTWWTMTSVLFHRDLLGHTGWFRTDQGSQADYEWALRAALTTDMIFVPGRMATWRRRQGQGTPLEMKPRYYRTMVDILNAVLRDGHAGVPAAWKTVPAWDREISGALRAFYLGSFGLWRRMALNDPWKFLKNLGVALRMEPALVARQTLRAFAWSEDFQVDNVEWARRLVKLFNAAWPPRRLPEG